MDDSEHDEQVNTDNETDDDVDMDVDMNLKNKKRKAINSVSKKTI